MTDNHLEEAADLAAKGNGWSLLIDAVAARSAKKAVNETFFLLGVDLNDPDHVRSTRDVITSLRDEFASRQRRKEAWSKGLVHGVITVVGAFVIAAGSYLVNGHASINPHH